MSYLVKNQRKLFRYGEFNNDMGNLITEKLAFRTKFRWRLFFDLMLKAE